MYDKNVLIHQMIMKIQIIQAIQIIQIKQMVNLTIKNRTRYVTSKLPEAVQINLKYFNNLEIRCIKDVMNKAKANFNKHVSIEERVTYEDCAYDIGEALRRIKLLNRQRKRKCM